MSKKRLRGLAMLVSTVLASSFLGANALAVPAESSNNPTIGTDGYVHLNQYVTPTELEDVYKVELSLGGYADPKPTDVIIILDNSGSMSLDAANQQPSGFTSGQPYATYDNRWKWACDGAKSAFDVFLNPDKNPGADKTRVALVAFGGGGSLDRYYNNTDGLRFTTRSSATLSASYSDSLQPITGATADGFVTASQQQNLIDAVNAFTTNDSELTDMNAGITEAKQLFSLASTNHPTHTGTSYDQDVRKFVVFLTDGADTGDSAVTLTNVDDMKDDGITFMTIGLGLSSTSGLFDRSKFATNWNTHKEFSSGADYWTYLDNYYSTYCDNGYFDIPGDQYSRQGGGFGNPEPIQQLIFMGMTLNPGSYNTYSSWESTDPLWWSGTGSLIPGSLNTGALTMLGVPDPYSFNPPGSSPVSGSVAGTYNIANWGGAMPEFKLADNSSQVADAFIDYANSIIRFGKDVISRINISDPFTIYTGYPGMSGWYKTTGALGQTVSRNGQEVTWDAAFIPLIGYHTLTFYIKCDSSKTDGDLWYPTSVSTYLSYEDTKFLPGTKYVKYYPSPLVQGKDKVAEEEKGTFYKTTDAQAAFSAFGSAFPISSTIPVYTPSVTPQPRAVNVSNVEEGTEDQDAPTDDGSNDAPDDTPDDYTPTDDTPDDSPSDVTTTPPVTGQASNVIVASLLIGLVLLAVVVTSKKRRQNNTNNNID